MQNHQGVEVMRPGQVRGVGSCRTGANPGRFLSETTKIFAAGFRPPDPTELVPDSSRFFQILPDFVGFRQNPTISGPESGRKHCFSWASMSLYEKHDVVDGEIEDNGPGRCHKIIRANCRIIKRIGLKKLSYSDHARFLTEEVIESCKTPMVNELIENECITNTFDFNHGFIETNDRNNESSEYPKSFVHELVDNNNAKSVGNQLERNNCADIDGTLR
ncbi:unnamed protein product [Rotaria socialis]|uniref:Uncharacterized protein n=1 Tax=Rotaria socialis TaxID=392032 RepID=A0A818WJI6_9BILA|nr:unnamed protein product [Rotaria socialis]